MFIMNLVVQKIMIFVVSCLSSYLLFFFFEHKRGHSSCEVKFEIIAEIYQRPASVVHTNPHSKHELVVEASTDITLHDDTSLGLPAEMIPVNGCCCSKKGSMSLETKFDKTTIPVISTITRHSSSNQDGIAPNTLSVDFRCQNRSTVRVDRIRMQLMETIEWTANGYQEQLKTVLVKVDLDASQFPELDKLRKRDRRRLQRREYFGVDSDDMLTLQHQPWHTIGPLQVPRHAKDTYHGRAIQIRHVLSVELITNGCCMSNPDASTMVQIYRRLADTQDHDSQEGFDSCSAPSAPLEDNGSSMVPSAPSEFYDESLSSTFYVAEVTRATPVHSSSNIVSADVLVEAQALPPDWHAQTAEVVTIPMAEAIVLGPLIPPSSHRVTPSA
jgi:hypothetical protein